MKTLRSCLAAAGLTLMIPLAAVADSRPELRIGTVNSVTGWRFCYCGWSSFGNQHAGTET